MLQELRKTTSLDTNGVNVASESDPARSWGCIKILRFYPLHSGHQISHLSHVRDRVKSPPMADTANCTLTLILLYASVTGLRLCSVWRFHTQKQHSPDSLWLAVVT